MPAFPFRPHSPRDQRLWLNYRARTLKAKVCALSHAAPSHRHGIAKAKSALTHLRHDYPWLSYLGAVGGAGERHAVRWDGRMSDLRPLTDDEILRAHRLWRDHRLHTRSIASVLGVPEATIWNYIEFVKHGVAPSQARVSA